MYLAKRDADGHVILAPRNFTTKQPKQGKTDASLFSRPTYVSVEDPFKVPLEKVMRTSDPEGHKKAGHDVPFKPAKTVKDKPYKAPYEHLTDRVEVKKSYKDADGHVVIEPKNFYTSPAKKGRVGKLTYFTPQPEHLPDDYNYPKTLALKEFKEAKKLEQEKPFS